MRIPSTIAALAAAAALASCNTSGCLDNQSALPLAEFIDYTTDKALSVRGIEISGVGAPNDSVLVKATETISKVYLPMRSGATSVSWCFHYAAEGLDSPGINDTITFGYTSEPYFASDECGAFYQYRISSCRHTRHLMDSVVVVDSLVTNVELARIKIYYDPARLNPETPENPENPENPEIPGNPSAMEGAAR